jgi:solute carrier family 25 carnitine/acylcarnitine transporter 20/29
MSRDFAVDAAAGWVAGAASVFASQPLDTVLTRLQQSPPSARPASLVRELRREGGLRSLWRGTSPLAWVVPLQNALLFAGYGMGERLAHYLEAERTSSGAGGGGTTAAVRPSLLPVFMGGCAGGIAQSFVVSPMELVKVHLQSSSGPKPVHGLLAGATQVYATVGVPAIWRGLYATLLRDTLPHGVWFASYEWAKRELGDAAAGRLGVPSDAVPLTCGAFAAVVAWSVGYPADIIKTRIQMPRPFGEPPLSVLDVSRALLAEHRGNPLRAFYRGFGLKLLRAVPMNALSFVVYERAKTAIELTWPVQV